MKNLSLFLALFGLTCSLGASTFTLKSSLSGQDFNWADGDCYVGEPYPGPQSGDTIIIPSGVTAKVTTSAAQSNGTCGICEIHIEEGGVVEVWNSGVERKANNYFGKLTGTGTVNNSGTVRQDLYIQKSCEFGGRFEGKLNFVICTGATFAFLNPDQSFDGSPIFRGTSTFRIYRCFPVSPSVKNASSLGATGNFNYGTHSTVEYVGAPGLSETLSRSYWSGDYITYDSGAYGGFTYSGYTTPASSQRVYTLTGSNTVLSTFYGNIDTRTTYPGYAYIRKEGKGSWLLKAASNNCGAGVVDIHEGTLQIDTLAEKGTMCSLGYSDQLFAYGTSVKTDAAVDYAVILGGGEYPAVLEYVGSVEAVCSSRPLIVTNSGTIASSKASMSFSDISAAGVGEHTLTLAGGAGVTNFAGMVANGTRGGELNLVKEGEGAWNLQASGDITGTLAVNGGLLSVIVPDRKYRWYRVWITENAYGSSRYDTTYSSTATGSTLENEKSYLQFAEIALYNENGEDLALKCACLDKLAPRQFAPDGDYSAMQPGELAYGRLSSITPNNVNGFFGSICDGSTAVTKTQFSCAKGGIIKSQPETWVPYVFRLPEGLDPVVRIDIAQSLTGKSSSGNPCYEGRNPTAFQVDASADGLNWDENIARSEAIELQLTGQSTYYWLESGTASSVMNGNRANAGWEFEQTEPGTSSAIQNHYQFESISVANGGIFKASGGVFSLDNLVVDASLPAGAFDNVFFMKKGTINVVNYASGTRELPLYVGNIASGENVCNWTVIVDGKISKRPLRINANGKLEFASEGFKILYRQ